MTMYLAQRKIIPLEIYRAISPCAAWGNDIRKNITSRSISLAHILLPFVLISCTESTRLNSFSRNHELGKPRQLSFSRAALANHLPIHNSMEVHFIDYFGFGFFSTRSQETWYFGIVEYLDLARS